MSKNGHESQVSGLGDKDLHVMSDVNEELCFVWVFVVIGVYAGPGRVSTQYPVLQELENSWMVSLAPIFIGQSGREAVWLSAYESHPVLY